MSDSLLIRDLRDLRDPVDGDPSRNERSITLAELPLRVGGAASDIATQALEPDDVACLIGWSEDSLFVQPLQPGERIGERTVAVSLRGAPLAESRWLRPGDVIELADLRIRYPGTSDSLVLEVQAGTSETTERANADELAATPPDDTGASAAPENASAPIAVEATPYVATPRRLRERRSWSLRVAMGGALAILLVSGWFLFTARPVEIQIQPEPSSWSLRGGPLGLPALDLGGRSLASPGHYRVRAQRPGYQLLDEVIEIGDAPLYEFVFSLQKLPGLLSLSTDPVDSARVEIDGAEIGTTPVSRYPLPPGVHEVRVSADLYREHVATLEIEGAGLEQNLQVVLEALFADVAIDSEPSGAVLFVDGVERGPTPRVEALGEGERELELRLPGYETWRWGLRVRARRPTDLGVITLEQAGGVVDLESRPKGALVTLDGVFQGQTPLELAVSAGATHEVVLSKRGYRPATRELTLGFGSRRELSVPLTPRTATLRIATSPEGATIAVDGRLQTASGQVLTLSAIPHALEISSDGFEPFHTTVTPRPGFAQQISVALTSHQEAKRRATPDRVKSSQGQALLLVRGGRFVMGAPRRQQGRRANEVEREVEITKPFYAATTEVSNRRFREFDPSHSGGRAGATSLDGPDHPVVGVSWQEAAGYCNWLSQRESLPLAYEDRGGTLVPASPPNGGYRLLTEAEWAWIARGAARSGDRRKFAWGDGLTPPEGFANLGDRSGSRILGNVLTDYNDGYPATAPVASFPADSLGFSDLAGNAAEWTQDFYASDPRDGRELEVDPRGPVTGEYHVIRGASWRDASIGPLRLSYRDYGAGKRSDVGFRIARTVPTPAAAVSE